MKNKKGFTVVELVIVIAIIAILAAVLIPTFASIIKKANVSKDQQLIRNLNTALAADTKKHTTMESALEAAYAFGYDISKINASATDNEILWDSKNDLFCYYDAASTAGSKVRYIPESNLDPADKPADDSPDYFCIVNEKNASKAFPDASTLKCPTYGMNWSCYLAYVPSGVTEVTTGTGVDVGKTESITRINYSHTSGSAQSVIIRTTGGIISVNAPGDTVSHFGGAVFLDIIAVGTASYHEFGYIPQAQIQKGRVVNEAGTVELKDGSTVDAGIKNLFLIGKDASSFDEIIVAAAVGAKLPALDRTDVTINCVLTDPGTENARYVSDIVLVAKVEEGVVQGTSSYDMSNYDYIYLFKAGVKEQILTAKAKVKNVAVDHVIVDGTPSFIANVELFGGGSSDVTFVVGTGNVGNPDSKQAAIEIANIPQPGTAITDLNKVDYDVEPKASIDDVAQAQGDNAKFDGGIGSVGNPYLISKGAQFKLITAEDGLNEKHYKIINDITVVDDDFVSGQRYLIDELSGSLDGGDGISLSLPDYNSTDEDQLRIIQNLRGGTVKNIEVYFEKHGTIVGNTYDSSSFINVNVHADIFCDNNYGAFVETNRGGELRFSKCDFYGSIYAIEGSKSNNNAIYVGYNLIRKDDGNNPLDNYYYFEDCVNYGTLMSGDAGMFIGSGNQNDLIGSNPSVVLNIQNCANEGYIIWTCTEGEQDYRPYNHFVGSNLQEVKEIIINDIRYVKVVNEAQGKNLEQLQEHRSEATIAQNENSIISEIQATDSVYTVRPMTQINAINSEVSYLWGTSANECRLYKHTSPSMEDANYRNGQHFFILPLDKKLAIHENDNGTFKVVAAERSGVSYYDITIKTYGHYNGSSSVFTVLERIPASSFVAGKYTSTIKNLPFVDDKWINNHSGGQFGTLTATVSLQEPTTYDYETYTDTNNIVHYYHNDSPYVLAGDAYKNKPGKVTVSAFDAEGKLLATAGLTEDPGVVNLVEDGRNGSDLDALFHASAGKAVWKQRRSISNDATGNGKESRYNAQLSSSNEANNMIASCGFIKIDTVNNGNGDVIPTYYLKTKSQLNNLGDSTGTQYERIMVACEQDDNGTKIAVKAADYKLLSPNLNGVTLIATEGEFYVYSIDLSTIFSNVTFDLVNKTYYFKITLRHAEATKSIIYAEE